MAEINRTELSIEHLTVSFKTGKGTVHAVRDISLTLNKGETLAIVGESGSGKSVSARAILGIEAPNAIIEQGKILYHGDNLLEYSEKQFNRIRGNSITMIFQDPLSSLDPIVKIGPQLTEASILNNRTNRHLAAKEISIILKHIKKSEAKPVFQKLKQEILSLQKKYRAYFASLDQDDIESTDLHAALKHAPDFFEETSLAKNYNERLKELVPQSVYRLTKKMAYAKAVSIMREVGIPQPEKRFNQYPFEFSGGMRQRIVIAIAIAANPELLICDEPTTALDVTIQAQILELINRLKKSRGMSVIFITHDLGVVANVADRIAVMYAGKIVEYGSTEDIFYAPAHPYTWALLSSMPDLETSGELEAIPGTPPDMLNPPSGDAFAARNKYAMQIDFEQEPPMFRISDTHWAATWLLHPDAPKVELPESVKKRIARMQEVNHATD